MSGALKRGIGVHMTEMGSLLRVWRFQSRSRQPGTLIPRQEAGEAVGSRMWATDTHFDVQSVLQKRNAGSWNYVSHGPLIPLVGFLVSIWERGTGCGGCCGLSQSLV